MINVQVSQILRLWDNMSSGPGETTNKEST